MPLPVPPTLQGTPESGTEGASAWANDRQQAITDLTVTVDPIIADGDMVSVLLMWTGKDAETGSDVTWDSAGIFRFECGLIAENWVVADTLGRLMTSGEITEEELAGVTGDATPAP